MAEFRNIHTRIWKDTWFSELAADEKLLFIYLFSNERASVCGMYELPLKYIVFETGLPQERVTQILEKFAAANKAHYQNGIVWVVNLRRYNDSGDNAKVRIRIEKDLEIIPDCELKRMYYLAFKIPYPEPKIGYPKTESETETDTDTETDTETESDTEMEKDTETNQDTLKPATASPVGGDWYIRVFFRVTGMMAFPGNETDKIIPALDGLYIQHNRNENALVKYLKPYWERWLATKSKTGISYRRTNCAWLYNWAVAGELPAQPAPQPSGPSAAQLAAELKAHQVEMKAHQTGG